MLSDNGLDFRIPVAWGAETTMTIGPAHRRAECSLTVTRVLLAPGETVEAHVERFVASLAWRIPGLQAVGEEGCTIGGRPAAACNMRWEGPAGPMDQRVVAVESFYEGRRVAYLFGVTSTEVEAFSMLGMFEEMLATVTFDDEVPGASPGSTPARRQSGWEYSTHTTPDEPTLASAGDATVVPQALRRKGYEG